MEEEVYERGNWSGKLEFFLSAVGYAVGVGNVWRFPYLAYDNGGASFLFPYILMLFLSGLPLFFIELALGQFASQGPLTVWRMSPFFAGIGYAMLIISFVTSIYYNMIIAYAMYYMFVSFVSLDDDVPWKTCQGTWATETCREKPFPRLDDDGMNDTEKMVAIFEDFYNRTCVQNLTNVTTYSDFNVTTGISEAYNSFLAGLTKQFNTTGRFEDLTWEEIRKYDGFSECLKPWTTPSEEYWQRFVLRIQGSDSIGDLGDMSLKLALSLALSWLLIFACLQNGIKSSGKVVYFTATFPYAILVVLLVRGVTLDGYMEGIEFYVIPEWDKLLDSNVWVRAATQIFYSLGISFGGLLTMASYNKFDNNCYRDSILVSIINCGTSIFAGFAIFSLLGHMAYVTGKDVEDVVSSGPGLAFVAYPDGLSRLPASSLWSFLFFFMLLTLGMDSQFAMLETVVSGISDIFPRFLRKHKTSFTLIICVISYFLGLPLCMEGGIQVMTLMLDYSGTYNLLVIAIAEIICLMYVYGFNNFLDDCEMMLGFKPGIYWKATWLVITPGVTAFMTVISGIQYEVSGYGGKTFPGWAEGIGWFLVALPIAAMILVGLIQLYRYGGLQAFKPDPLWGPAEPENCTGRYAAMNANVENNGYSLPTVTGNVKGFDDLNSKGEPPSYTVNPTNNDLNQAAEKYIQRL